MSDEGYNDDVDFDFDSDELDEADLIDKEAQEILDRLKEVDPREYPCKGMVFEEEELESFFDILPYLTKYAEIVDYKETRFKIPFQDYEVEVISTLN